MGTITVPFALEHYRGNKGFIHAYQEIINHIPPHQIYGESFLGSGGIYCHKKPSAQSYLCDIDPHVVKCWNDTEQHPMTKIINNTALNHISMLERIKQEHDVDVFIYLDPPYPISSLLSKKQIYKYSMTDEEHMALLGYLQTVTADCMISTYSNPMYDEELKTWRKEIFMTCIHGKPKEEILYMNYDKPDKLHDYQYLGSDCWDRQRINRKINRHIKKLQGLPTQERNAIIEAINEIDS